MYGKYPAQMYGYFFFIQVANFCWNIIYMKYIFHFTCAVHKKIQPSVKCWKCVHVDVFYCFARLHLCVTYIFCVLRFRSFFLTQNIFSHEYINTVWNSMKSFIFFQLKLCKTNSKTSKRKKMICKLNQKQYKQNKRWAVAKKKYFKLRRMYVKSFIEYC